MKMMIVGVTQCHTGQGENLFMTGSTEQCADLESVTQTLVGFYSGGDPPMLNLHPSRMACFQDQQAT